MMDPIAGLTIYGKRPDDFERFQVHIAIGAPYPYEIDQWRCQASLQPLYPKLGPAIGDDSFQVLCFAISLVQDLLHDFREKGGKLTFETREEFPLEAYSFGFASQKQP